MRGMEKAQLSAPAPAPGGKAEAGWHAARSGWSGAGTAGQGQAVALGRDIKGAVGGSRSLSQGAGGSAWHWVWVGVRGCGLGTARTFLWPSGAAWFIWTSLMGTELVLTVILVFDLAWH